MFHPCRRIAPCTALSIFSVLLMLVLVVASAEPAIELNKEGDLLLTPQEGRAVLLNGVDLASEVKSQVACSPAGV